jgi:predicted transcriptional regulator
MADLKTNLENIDLSKITLADLGRLKSPALRDALVDLARRPGGVEAFGHQNHGSHSNHGTESAKFLELQFALEKAKSIGG